LLEITDKKASLLEAFNIADDVLKQGIQGISDLIAIPAVINLDFADVKTIMDGQGLAHMGIGFANGENRSVDAAKQAIKSPLLETSINGARGVLINITGGSDLGIHEVNEAAEIITESADPEANIIFGANIDEELGDSIKVTVIATGFSDGIQRRIKNSESGEEKTELDKETFVNWDDDDLNIPDFINKDDLYKIENE
jgi:cell division protein FtsZ